MPKSILFLTGLVFAAVAVLHLLRLIYGWSAVIGAWEIPLWVSIVGVGVAGILSGLHFFYASR